MKIKLPSLRLPFDPGALLARLIWRGGGFSNGLRRRGRHKWGLPPVFVMAVLLIVGIIIGILYWLWINDEEARQLRAADAPLVSVVVVGGVPYAKTDQPPAKPDAHAEAVAPSGPITPRGITVGVPPDATPPPDATLLTENIGKAAPGPGPDEVFALTKAPALGLTEKSARNSLLPAIASDGRQPWQVYARPFSAADRRGRIAIVIGQMGVAGAATGMALQRLQPGVTLAFVPVAERLDGWIEAARGRGHEVVMSVPMEPLNYPREDPGPNTLLLAQDTAHNLDRLEWALARFHGYVGVTSPSGSRFGADSNAMRSIMEVFKKRGLMFLDARTAQGNVGLGLATELGVPRAYVNRMIDQDPSRTAIDAELAMLETIALKDGAAVGMGTPYPTTLERLVKWIPLLPDKKLILVPLSALANLQKMPEPPKGQAEAKNPTQEKPH